MIILKFKYYFSKIFNKIKINIYIILMYSDNQEDQFSCFNDNEISYLGNLFVWNNEDKSCSMHSSQDSSKNALLFSFPEDGGSIEGVEISKKIIGKKRGRKSNKVNDTNYKPHSKYKQDNLKRTIQVHFLTFLIQFLNAIMDNLHLNYSFKDLDYKYKININNKNIDKLKTKSIKDILLEAPISPKNKIVDKNHNIKVIEKIEKNYKYLLNILEQNYSYILKSIYLKDIETINLNEFNIFYKEIDLNIKVNTFKDITKSENEDLSYKIESEKTAKKYFSN